MATRIMTPAIEELVGYLAGYADPLNILEFEFSEAAQMRMEILLERQHTADFTPEEACELEQMLYTSGLLSVVKAQALERYAAHLKQGMRRGV